MHTRRLPPDQGMQVSNAPPDTIYVISEADNQRDAEPTTFSAHSVRSTVGPTKFCQSELWTT